jgi:hypothetical protein
MPRKRLDTTEEEFTSVLQSMNDREPEDDWQRLLKAVIGSVMDDFIKLQHPSRRNEGYFREAFQLALAALYDDDYCIEWPGPKGEKTVYTFKEILHERFGLDNISKREIQKMDMFPFREALIKSAEDYWSNKQLSCVTVPDFFTFRGYAYTVFLHKKPSSVDDKNAIIYIKRVEDDKLFQINFLEQVISIIDMKDNIKLTDIQKEKMARALWEVLRMNSCFRVKV